MHMKFITIIFFAIFINTGVVKSQQLPANWHQKTIGQTQQSGSCTFSKDIFTISGSGSDIWDNLEEYHYVYTNVADSIEIIAKIESIENTHEWAKAGIIIIYF